MSRVVINMDSEKKDFLISQAKMSGKNMAQFIADLSAQDNLTFNQERQIKRHNEALYFITKSLLVWEYYLFHDPEFEGKKIVNHARHEAVKIYQSVSKKEQITEDITLFYLVYANQIFWAVARFCNRNYPSSNIGKAVNSNIKFFCQKRFTESVFSWFEKQQVCPLSIDLDEKKVRWEIRLSDELRSVLEERAYEHQVNVNEFIVQVLNLYCLEQDCEKLLEFDPRERLLTFLCIAYAKANETTWAIQDRNNIMLEAQEQTYQILSDKDWLLLCSIYSWRLNRLALDVRPIPPRARVKCLEYVEQGVGRLNLEPRLHLVEQEEPQDA